MLVRVRLGSRDKETATHIGYHLRDNRGLPQGRATRRGQPLENESNGAAYSHGADHLSSVHCRYVTMMIDTHRCKTSEEYCERAKENRDRRDGRGSRNIRCRPELFHNESSTA